MRRNIGHCSEEGFVDNERNHEREPRSYRKRQTLPFLGEIDRRRVPDRRTSSNTEINVIMIGGRQFPDRRINSIEVDWIAEGTVISK
jgi:hypothetical protein